MSTYLAYHERDFDEKPVLVLEVDDATGRITKATRPGGGENQGLPASVGMIGNLGTRRGAATLAKFVEFNRNLRVVKQGKEPVEKSVYRLVTEQSQEEAGYLLVDDETQTIEGYSGDNPPVGYQAGQTVQQWAEENRGYKIEPVPEAVPDAVPEVGGFRQGAGPAGRNPSPLGKRSGAHPPARVGDAGIVSLRQPAVPEATRLAQARCPILVGQPADDEVLDALAAEVELPLEIARDFTRLARHVIDCLVADDIPVVDDGLVLAPAGHPVVERLKERLADPNWQPPQDLLYQDDDDLAEALGLPIPVVQDHRPAGYPDIFVGVLEKKGLSEDGPEADMLHRFLVVWLDTFKKRRYFVSHIGREAAFEAWLTKHLERVTPYDLELLARQWRSQDRKHRPDLICRVRTGSERLRAGTILVLELKAGVADEHAVAQLERYLSIVRAEFATERQNVAGFLVADGTLLGLHEQLTDKGIGYASATELGYRDYLFTESQGAMSAGADSEPATLRQDEVLVQTSTSLPVGARRRTDAWQVGGQAYATRRSANRALAAMLGSYTSEQWARAQRDHGLR